MGQGGHQKFCASPVMARNPHAGAWLVASYYCGQFLKYQFCSWQAVGLVKALFGAFSYPKFARLLTFAAGFLVAFVFLASGTAFALNNFPGTTITGSSGSLTASNVGATGQTGEPITYGGGSLNTMWYSWTAPGNGTLNVQTCGGSTNFDTTLLTFTGAAVNALTNVATNDDSCGTQSVNIVPVTSGVVYRIQVDGYGNGTGTFTLTWTFSPAVVTPPAPTATQVCSALTNTWSGNSATSGGIGVTVSRSAAGGGSWSAAATNTMNTINAFSEAAVQGRPSIVETFNWNEIRSLGGGTGDYTITFAKPVLNPVIHIDRIGGIIGTGQSNSSFWTLVSGGTMYRLAGAGHLQTYSDNTIVRTIGVATAGGESSLNTATGTAAGSIMISGTHSSVTFRLSGDSPATGAAADAFEVVVCAPQADLSLAKSVDNAAPVSGADVTFTLTLTNSGADAAPGVQVTDLLPAGFTYVSSTPSQGTYNSGTGVWDVGTVAVGGTAPTLQIVATTSGTSAIVNSAQVTASTYVDPDSDPNDGTGDDFASVTVTPSLPPVGSGSPRCVGTDLVANGGFEIPGYVPPADSNMTAPGLVTGWTTTDSAIEIWENGFGGVPSHTNYQFAELNAFIAGTLTSGPTTVHPRAELQVYWAHRARVGTDVASMVVSDNGGGSTSAGSFSATTSAWVLNGATHVVSSGGTTTNLAFTAVSTGSGDASVGNFLDTVEICQTYLELTKTEGVRNDVDSSGGDSAGDTIEYVFTISNLAGNERNISTVEIVDDKIGTFSATPVSGDDGDNILEPGETWTVNATYTLAQADLDAESVTNIAYAQGNTGINTIRSDDETVTAALTAAPSMTIDKVATYDLGAGTVTANGTTDELPVGTVVTYTYTVTNTGNQTITDVDVDDSGHTGQGTFVDPSHNGAGLGITSDAAPLGDSTDGNPDDAIWGALAPNDVLTFGSSYVVTQADMDGQI